MKYLITILVLIFLIGFVSSAYYVADPDNCPVSYQSQTCSGSDVVCGYSGGVTFCYDPTGINPPNADSTTTGTGGTDRSCEDTTCSGGFVIDCYYYDGSAPHCDNGNTGFCDRNPTCYNKHVQTTCTKDVFVTSSCSATCTTSYVACDGSSTDADGCEVNDYTSNCDAIGEVDANNTVDSGCGCICDDNYLDCDEGGEGVGNGCEVLDGGSCEVGSLSGTIDGCSGGVANCVVDKSYFETGTKAEYQTNSSVAFLWGVDYYIGNLLNLSWSSGGGLYVNSTGVHFNGTLLGSGGGDGATNHSYLTEYNITNSSYLTEYNITNASYVVNHSTVVYNVSVNNSYYWNNSFGWNTTQIRNSNGVIDIIYSWIYNLIMGVAKPDTFAGNYSYVLNTTHGRQDTFFGNYSITVNTSIVRWDTFFGNYSTYSNKTYVDARISANYSALDGNIDGNYSSLLGNIGGNSSNANSNIFANSTESRWLANYSSVANWSLVNSNFTRFDTNINNNITAWLNQTNSSYVTAYGSNMTGNLNMTKTNITFTNGTDSQGRICFDELCRSYIYNNGSGLVIRGG